MSFASIAKAAERYAIDNSPTILTGIAAAGTVITAYLTGKASIKAARLIDADNAIRRKMGGEDNDFLTKVQLVWPEYLPAVGTGSVTIACIIGAHKIGSRRAAAVAAAYSLSERAFAEYKEKVVEKIGEKKHQVIYDEIAQRKVENDPPSSKEIVITGNGDVMCYDTITGRYFLSNMESIRKAENDINRQIINEGYVGLTEFYDRIGLPGTAFSEEVGWNYDNPLEIKFSTVMSEDGKPCIAIQYNFQPVRQYYKLQ